MKNHYLERYAWPGPIIQEPVSEQTEIIVVIPCYNEPEIKTSLLSLLNCEIPGCDVELIVVINHGENERHEIKDFNINTSGILREWIKNNNKEHYSIHLIDAFDLPKKHAGVGLARKIGMDEAVRRFESIHKNGAIVCFDADSTCTNNYLSEIYKFFNANDQVDGCCVYFEHPVRGLYDNKVYEGIINYELHLRYYRNALKYALFPFAYHTIGSCMAITSEVYQKQGGMNKKKAGEDFYFLQKIFPLGNFHALNSTKIIPSPRPSDRVPFGTGRAISNYLNQPGNHYFTYNPKIFIDFRIINENAIDFYNEANAQLITNVLPDSLIDFLHSIDFVSHLYKIRKNTASEALFLKAFYNWFNGFKALKFVHYAKDHFYKDVEILEAANWLLNENKLTETKSSKIDALWEMRRLDRLQ